MRILLDFPDGFGTDPTMMLGPLAPTCRTPLPSKPIDPPSVGRPSRAHVPGPFRASYESGLKPIPLAELEAEPALAGFHPHIGDTETDVDEPVWREPPSVVVPTVIVGLFLALAGYVFDIG